MFRKNYFNFLLAAALFLMSGIVAFAQTAPVSGRVELKKADGTTAPVADALVEVLRMDVKSKLPSDKTDKKGNFAFAGLPLGGRYILVVSGTGIAPMIFPNVRAGSENFAITVTEGDGKRFTEEEVRQSLAQGASSNNSNANTETKSAELTEEQKKAKAEYDKQVAEITEKNKKIQAEDAIVQKAIAEGNAAFNAKNYDLAIVKFDEGYKASPDYVGSAPVFLNNKGIALRIRGVETYNQSIKATDPSAKVEGMNKVLKDFSEALDAFNASWTLLKNTPAASVPDAKSYESNKMQALRGAKELVKFMAATEKVDNSKIGIAKTLIQEYLTTETDQAAKAQAQINLADLYRVAGDSDNAVAEYKKALEISPDNPDALAGLGLSLFNAGEINNNVAQKQEGLGYMERFAQVAPDNHKLKSSVADAVTYLKSQKITSTKVTNTKKKN
jgi:tetratricopeptide (TPR) repeat protein